MSDLARLGGLCLSGDDTPAGDLRLVGGKAAQLLRLRGLGCRVPEFVIVTCAAFDARLHEPQDALRLAALRQAFAGGDEAWRVPAAELRASLLRCGPSSALLRELRDELRRRGLLHVRLAMRSSALVEDGARHSFAGLLDSRLGMTADGLGAALAAVWASAFSERALAYRQRLGLGLEGLGTAVIVQRLVPAAAAGVVFTRDPDDARQVLIAAGLGLGESVVQGSAACDTFRVARRGAALQSEVALKAQRIESSPDGRSVCVEVPADEAARPALGARAVRALAALALRLERAWRAPLDLEWALDDARCLHVLQARPITAAARAWGERRVWDNANVVESYPGLTRPLTYSFAREAYARAFEGTVASLLPLGNPLRARPHLVANLIGLVDGRVYYNLLDWYELFACLARPAAHRRSWERQLGIEARAGAAHDAPAPAALPVRALALVGVLARLMTVRRTGRRFAARFAAWQARFGAPAPREATPEGLARTYRALALEAGSFWHLTLLNDLAAMRYQDALEALCRRFCPHEPALAATLVACGAPPESLQPVLALHALAAQVGRDPRAAMLSDDARLDERETWDALLGLPGWEARLRAHVERWGDRGLEELKLETRALRAEPWRLVGQLRAARGCQDATRARDDAKRAREGHAGAQVARLALPRRVLLRFVLRRARLALHQRESMRLARARLFGLARTLFTRLGQELCARGVLRQADQVFDLTVDEVLGAVEGGGVTRDLRALAELRQREYADYARLAPPARFETRGLRREAGMACEASASAGGEKLLRGVPCAAGWVTAPARVVGDAARAGDVAGRILVADSTDPGWIFLMMSAAGLVAERGSALSHTAIVGRELGLPTVVGVKGATALIPDGARVTLDGALGEVRWR